MDQSTAALLRNVPLFSGLNDASIQALSLHCRRRKFSGSAALFHEGDSGHTLYIIASGRINIQTSSTTGEIVHLAQRGPGETVGEMALIDGKPRMADAVTAEPSEILMLDREEFIRCVAESPEIAMGVMACLADRLREAANQFESQQALDVLGRVAELILGLADQRGVAQPDGAIRVSGKVTQQDMADRLGTTRESVNRALSNLRRVRAIRMDGRQIVVLNASKLRQFFT